MKRAKLHYLVCVFLLLTSIGCAQSPEKIIIDTDIGDDIDDAFALALALTSPELKILGVATTFGDTELRAKLADRLSTKTSTPSANFAA